MNREEQFVITISRQFGTGGHEIGAEIARRLGVKLLDKQILNEVARERSEFSDAGLFCADAYLHRQLHPYLCRHPAA